MRCRGIRGSVGIEVLAKLEKELRHLAGNPALVLADFLLPNVQPAHVQPMEAIEFLDEVQQVGVALAERKIKPEHFAHFLPDDLKP